jgi:hypothetical protein
LHLRRIKDQETFLFVFMGVLILNGYYQNNLWKCKTDYGTYIYFRDVLNDIVNCFPISPEEAIDLINSNLNENESYVEGDFRLFHTESILLAGYFYWDPNWSLKSQKPMKENRQTKYELYLPKTPYESDWVNDFIYIDSKVVSFYKQKGIINEKYYNSFEVSVLNYEQALRELSKYKGEKYFKEPIFEGFY